MHLSFIYPRSSNLGDDIQTLAATQYLQSPQFVDRDRLSLSQINRANEPKLILNGWWTHDPKNAFPPPPHFDCLPISMHIHEKAQSHFKMNAGWFKGKKVLARDVYTDKFLKSIGVDSEFGGCLTLTLPRNEPKERKGIIVVDAPEVKIEGAQWRTHKTPHIHAHEKRRQEAQLLLDTYQKAELVITKRLHCALPCVAMGTPVILIMDNPRSTGMEKFVPIARTIEEVDGLIDVAKNFDRSEIEKYANNLRQTVTAWLTSH